MADYHRQTLHSAEMRRLSTEGRGTKVAEDFWLSEFQCNDGTDILLLHEALPALLQRIRDHFGDRTVTVNSAFRTAAYNEKIGGASKSRHLHGLAADIEVEGIDPRDVANFAETLDVGGIGRYNDFTHVDVYGRDRRWDKTTGGDT